MSDEEVVPKVLADMGEDFSPPPKEVVAQVETDWETWANSIEIRVSRLGQVTIGLVAGTLIALAVGFLNGRVVVNLVKSQKVIIEHLNALGVGSNSDSVGAHATGVRYATPSVKVDTTKSVVDEELKADLEQRMKESTSTGEPEL